VNGAKCNAKGMRSGKRRRSVGLQTDVVKQPGLASQALGLANSLWRTCKAMTRTSAEFFFGIGRRGVPVAKGVVISTGRACFAVTDLSARCVVIVIGKGMPLVRMMVGSCYNTCRRITDKSIRLSVSCVNHVSEVYVSPAVSRILFETIAPPLQRQYNVAKASASRALTFQKRMLIECFPRSANFVRQIATVLAYCIVATSNTYTKMVQCI